MRYKIITIAGIIFLFGYFIMDSFKNASSNDDPNRVVMVGNDTLGRDWGAQADQRDREKKEKLETVSADDGPGAVNGNLSEGKTNGVLTTSEKYTSGNGAPVPDPFEKPKLNSSDYSTVMDGNGREVITGYDPEQSGNDNYQTRHQRDRNEPVLKTRE